MFELLSTVLASTVFASTSLASTVTPASGPSAANAAELATAFLNDLALVLATAAATTILFRTLRLPVALGYVLAGMLLGPHLPTGIDANPASVSTLSELGVTLLMFAVGLELSVSKIFRVGVSALLTAVVEVSLVFWLGYMLGRGFGASARECVFLGAALSVSSTMLVTKTVREGDPLRSFVLGILVIEDVLAIVILALLTPLTGAEGASLEKLSGTLLKLIGFLVAALAVGIVFIPRAIRYVRSLGSDETTLVAVVGLCFSLAMLAHAAGFSVALGAFIAGAIVAEGGDGGAVEHLIAPLRDLFAAIFLVAVGMQVDPNVLRSEAWLVAAMCAVVLLGKVLGVTLGGVLTGTNLDRSMQAGAGLAQVGELSFVIAALGQGLGPFADVLPSAVVGASLGTALLAAPAYLVAPKIAWRMDKALPESLRLWLTFHASWLEKLRALFALRDPRFAGPRRFSRNLIIDTLALCLLCLALGLGRTRVLAFLREHRIPMSSLLYLACGVLLSSPLLLGLVRNAQRLGTEMSLLLLPAPEPNRVDLAASARRVFVVTLQLLIVSLVGLPVMAVTQPFLPAGTPLVLFVLVNAALLVVFVRRARSFRGHVRAGTSVLIETFRKQVQTSQPNTSAPTTGPSSPEGHATADEPAHKRAESVLPGFSNLTTVSLGRRSRAVGQSLAQLNLRGVTGASVLAIRRQGQGLVPSPSEQLQSGDELVLTGTQSAVDAAQSLLTHAEGQGA